MGGLLGFSAVMACGKKLLTKSVGPGFEGPVPPARGQRIKQAVCRMRADSCDCLSSGEVQWDNHTMMQKVRMLLMVEG